MAVTSMSGFESADASTESISLGSNTAFSTVQARTGTRSVRCNPASGAFGSFTYTNWAAGNWLHFGLYIATLPSLTRIIVGAGGTTYTLKLNSTGTLGVFDGASTQIGSNSSALSTGQWYWIGLRPPTTGTNVDWLQINGASAVNATQTITSTLNVNIGFNDSAASAADIYIDDIIIDSAGFLAPSKVNTALPISDNTVTGVTDNNGVTTNIWQCVSNVPPAGVASANEAANAKKGMHFTASATDNYIANLATYTTLGVGSGDTLIAVQSLVRQGEDIATGTKTMQNVGALTNPTVAGASITVGGDAGAHGAETGLWVTTFGTLTTASLPTSGNFGTSPTIRASRVSESRLACVDFMGMVVAWTPAAVKTGTTTDAPTTADVVTRIGSFHATSTDAPTFADVADQVVVSPNSFIPSRRMSPALLAQ
jgi:hypothetical protein